MYCVYNFHLREITAVLTFQAQLNKLNKQMLPHEQVGPKNFYKLWNRKFKTDLLYLLTAFILNYKCMNLHAYIIGTFFSLDP